MTSKERQALAREAQGLGERPALLIVDVIKGFTDPSCPLGSEASSVVDANRELMERFHQHNYPVYLTTVVYDSDEQAPVFRARVPALNILSRGSRWCDIDARLPLLPSDIIVEKTHASAFHETGLAEQLRTKGVDSLVIAGLTTSGCVRATAVDGLQHNFKVVVPEEATGDRDDKAHSANLYDLNAKYVDVLSLAKTLALL
jgi:nicotinamidase-related amidase